MKRMKKLFLCIVLSSCFILPSTASAIGPSPDLLGWMMSLLKNDDYDRQALIAQYRRSQSRAIEPEPTYAPESYSDPFGLRYGPRVRGSKGGGGYTPPRNGSPGGTVGTSTR